MPTWISQAIVLSLDKFGENKSIIRLFSEQKGLVAGITTINQKKKESYNIGNIVSCKWNGRLEEHLGTITFEVIENISSSLYFDFARLLAITSICSTVRYSLPEHEANNVLYEEMEKLLLSLKKNDNWVYKYILFEIKLLKEMGFALDYSKCAVTNQKNDLTHLSPKTGKAVCSKIAKEYEGKLIKLPNFLIDKSITPLPTNIVEALSMTNFFLEKNIFSERNYKTPNSKHELIKHFRNKATL